MCVYMWMGVCVCVGVLVGTTKTMYCRHLNSTLWQLILVFTKRLYRLRLSSIFRLKMLWKLVPSLLLTRLFVHFPYCTPRNCETPANKLGVLKLLLGRGHGQGGSFCVHTYNHGFIVDVVVVRTQTVKSPKWHLVRNTYWIYVTKQITYRVVVLPTGWTALYYFILRQQHCTEHKFISGRRLKPGSFRTFPRFATWRRTRAWRLSVPCWTHVYIYRAHTKRRTADGRTLELGKPHWQGFPRFRLFMRCCFECVHAFVKIGVAFIIVLCD